MSDDLTYESYLRTTPATGRLVRTDLTGWPNTNHRW